jgi:hypothetical protein
MPSFNSIQLSSTVPPGHYSVVTANIGGKWVPDVQPLLQAVSCPRCTAVADFVRLSEGTYSIISGTETRQFDSQIWIWSQGWKATANYNWLFTAQNTAVASVWTMEATVWNPTNAQELFYWFWIGGKAVRTAIEEKQSSGAVARLLPAGTATVSHSIRSQSADQNQLVKWIGKLESLSKLALGWNRHGAPAPSVEAIRGARQIIEAMVQDRQPPTRVAASAIGGVGVTRRVGNRMVYIEFYNDGAACALLADDAGDERVLEVAAERGSFRNLLDEVKAYLNG